MRRAHWLSWFVLIACAACGEREPDPPAPVAPVTPAAPREPLEEPAPEPASWPTEVEDLRASIARFESIDACVAELRARTPTLASEALADVGYDGFFDDACRALDAVVRRDASACDALSVSSARRGCRRRLAIVAGDPALCPEDLAIEGRDPICVAWAARDPALCRAASAADRASCERVLAGDAARCPRVDRARCEAWVRRYASALGDERRESAARAGSSLHLELVRVHPPSARGGAPAEDPPVAFDLDQLGRGVRLVAERCAHRVVLDQRGAPDVVTLGRPGFRAELELPARAELPLSIPIRPLGASLGIAHPRVGRASGGSGAFQITALDRTLGGEVAGTLDAELPMVPGVLRVHGEFRTFVRDLDVLPRECTGDRMPTP